MAKWIGTLKKLKSKINHPVDYFLRLGDQELFLNELLNVNIRLNRTGPIHCIQCGRKTSKSFQQGYCFPCFRRLQECNLCIIHPERCRAAEKPCPADDWAHAQCNQAHVVYLANSSGLKVGITRETQLPTRWIDQGAIQAMPIFKVSNRYRAGVMEVALKNFVNDRTDWRAMLKNDVGVLSLLEAWEQLKQQAKEAIVQVFSRFEDGDISEIKDNQPIQLKYPVLQYPEKITSLSLDNADFVQGKLLGIKGQYLILDTGVINIRKFGGYEIEFITSFAIRETRS